MYRESRKKAHLTTEEASFRLHISPHSIFKYESGERIPPPEVVLSMSREYKKPEMTVAYCKESCPIGQAYGYEMLTGVKTDFANITLKLIEEIEEAKEALDKVMKLVINKGTREDFSDQQWREFENAIMEFLDIEHGVEVLKMALGRIVDVSQLVEMHNRKCYEHGYIKKEMAL